MTIYTIYLITNLINNKKYVGQTKCVPHKRFKSHIADKKRILYSAIRKYGVENFKFEVIYQTLDVDHIDFLECHFIKEHNSLISGDGWGYNLESGGNLNKKLSVETRHKISITKIGTSLTEDHKRKIGDSRKGKMHTEESKQKMSESAKGIPKPQKITNCPHCGLEGAANNMTRYHFDNCKFK